MSLGLKGLKCVVIVVLGRSTLVCFEVLSFQINFSGCEITASFFRLCIYIHFENNLKGVVLQVTEL